MCNGMIESGPKTSLAPISAIKLLLSLLLVLGVVSSEDYFRKSAYVMIDDFMFYLISPFVVAGRGCLNSSFSQNIASALSDTTENAFSQTLFPECVRPYMVQNSWVNLTETNMDFFPAGTVLRYTCDDGYLPLGPSILTCTTFGRWSSEPPQCIRSGGKRLLIALVSDLSMFGHCLHSDCVALESRNGAF